MIDIHVPTLGESVQEASVGPWQKKEGQSVRKDEVLVELETDKVAVEVTAPEDGLLKTIVAAEGADVEIGGLLATLEPGVKAESNATNAAVEKGSSSEPNGGLESQAGSRHGPAVDRIAKESGRDPERVSGTGRDGRVTKGDMLAAVSKNDGDSARAQASDDGVRETRVPMSRLRRRVAERLKSAQQTAAILTTFNEVDMTEVMLLRKQYRDLFEKKHGVRLGFMSFFVRACVQALQEIPELNAEIDGDDVIYRKYCHVGVAIGSPRGLVVPVLRDAQDRSFAEIEKMIGAFGGAARDGKLAIEDLSGGTFSISNGGTYGSLMSTPILNPPQSGILGMHKIEQRAVVVNGEIVARPMMYLALSYDHRIVDGKEAVTFLVRVKEAIEEPARLMLDL